MAGAILQFSPFNSAVDAGFWHTFTNFKLNVLQLNDKPVPVTGNYVNSDPSGLPTRLSVEYDALDCKSEQASSSSLPAVGTLINTNTIEEFRERDKSILLNFAAKEFWESIVSGEAIESPSILASFLMFTFADLKKYHYYYWFAFPAFTIPKTVPLLKKPLPISSCFSSNQVVSLIKNYKNRPDEVHKGFFVITKSAEEFSFQPLTQYNRLKELAGVDEGEVFLGFADPCTLPENPGWPLRNLLTLAAVHFSNSQPHHKVLCLRIRTRHGIQEAGHSLILEVDLSNAVDAQQCIPEMPQCLGWEKNERSKMGPRMVDLASGMDPVRLAESAVDLNLKLMRWRVVPTLDLAAISNASCLLMGAGTLGCNVARCLMGWGVRNITFIDNGKLSFSNPVRQSLYNFEKCCNGGQWKAEAAAEELRNIFPKMNSRGLVLSIPMPGHTVSDLLKKQVLEDLATVEQLVKEHDVLFLLTDSRESRWLPTLLGAAYQKLVFTAALGFDSYLVMRHGVRLAQKNTDECSNSGDAALSTSSIPGHQLGCYFCNDVVAPGDSMSDRTLDQQCTVSRPGVSYMAAALATELMMSVLQHPDRGYAEASVNEQSGVTEGVLGPVPHSLRGFLARHQYLTPATSTFKQCPACSDKVVSMYQEEGHEFLIKVFNSPSYLEDVTGLSQLHKDIDYSQIWELSDSESEVE